MLLYGTSSWHEKSWVGVFYPDGMKAPEWLSYYATRFGTVEVDSTYYGTPRPTTVDNWVARTPDGFIMSAKWPRTIVHGGESSHPNGDLVLNLDRVAGERDEFLEVMGRLGSRCGPLVLQFPYFGRKVFESDQPFLERLDRFLGTLPGDFRYAVEVRNRTWVTPELLDLLRTHHVAFVWTEMPRLDHPADLCERLDLVTTDFIYGRLIGDRRATDALTGTWDRIVIDQGAALRRWARALSRVAGTAEKTFLYANNHYAGHGPETIRTLVRMLDEEAEA